MTAKAEHEHEYDLHPLRRIDRAVKREHTHRRSPVGREQRERGADQCPIAEPLRAGRVQRVSHRLGRVADWSMVYGRWSMVTSAWMGGWSRICVGHLAFVLVSQPLHKA